MIFDKQTRNPDPDVLTSLQLHVRVCIVCRTRLVAWWYFERDIYKPTRSQPPTGLTESELRFRVCTVDIVWNRAHQTYVFLFIPRLVHFFAFPCSDLTLMPCLQIEILRSCLGRPLSHIGDAAMFRRQKLTCVRLVEDDQWLFDHPQQNDQIWVKAPYRTACCLRRSHVDQTC